MNKTNNDKIIKIVQLTHVCALSSIDSSANFKAILGFCTIINEKTNIPNTVDTNICETVSSTAIK